MFDKTFYKLKYEYSKTFYSSYEKHIQVYLQAHQLLPEINVWIFSVFGPPVAPESAIKRPRFD